MAKRLVGIVAVLSCTFAAGCHQKVADKDGLVFTFQPWVPLLIALAGVAAVPAGVVLFKRGQRGWGIGVGVVVPLIAAAIAPGIYLDYVRVNQEGFSSRHGFWWDPTIHRIPYAELEVVRVTVEEKNGRRGKSYSYYFDCVFTSGKKERVPLGDIMREALPEIAEQFRQNGVPVEVPPNLPR